MADKPELQPIFNLLQAKQPTPLDRLASLQQAQAQLGMQGIQEQRQGIDDTQAKLARLRATQPDMEAQKRNQALIALGDFLGDTGGKGSQIFQMFKQDDKSKEIAGAEKLLAQQRMGLSKSELGLLDQQLTGSYRDAQLALQQDVANRKMKELEMKKLSKGLELTPGQKEVDKKFAKDYASWTTGGFSNVQGNLGKLQGALDTINKEGEVGSVLLPEAVRARTNPLSVTVEQDVGNVVFQSLKEILGGQFTEKEGQKLVQQSYDPRLSDAENAAKVKDSLEKLRNMANAKQEAVEYYSEHGSLKGFKGTSSTTMDQFEKELKTKYLGESSTAQQPTMQFKNPKANDLAKELGL